MNETLPQTHNRLIEWGEIRLPSRYRCMPFAPRDERENSQLALGVYDPCLMEERGVADLQMEFGRSRRQFVCSTHCTTFAFSIVEEIVGLARASELSCRESEVYIVAGILALGEWTLSQTVEFCSEWSNPWQPVRTDAVPADLVFPVETTIKLIREIVSCEVGQPQVVTDPENQDNWWLAVPIKCRGSVEEIFPKYERLIAEFVRKVRAEHREKIRLDLQLSGDNER